MGDCTKIDMAAWDRDFRINVTSMVLMSRHVVPEMRKKGRGSIVNMSSVSGRMSPFHLLPYPGLQYFSPWRESEPAIPYHQRCNHPNDTRNGRTAWV